MTRIRQTMEKKSRRSRAAFTLIETIVGSALIVVVFGALLVAIAHGYGVMRSTSESRRATQILIERIEGLRLYSWDQIVSGARMPTNFVSYFNPPDTTVTNIGTGAIYYGTVGIAPVALDPLPGYSASLRQVTVSVNWMTDGQAHQRSLSTFVARDGIQNYVYTR